MERQAPESTEEPSVIHHHAQPAPNALRVPSNGFGPNSPKVRQQKPSFNRPFKQATFENRGKQDGSSNLHVTFTSGMPPRPRAEVTAALAAKAAAALAKPRPDMGPSRALPQRPAVQPLLTNQTHSTPERILKEGATPPQRNASENYTKPAGLVQPLPQTQPSSTPTGPAIPKPKSKSGIPLYKDIVTIDKRKIAEEVDNLPKPDHLLDAEKELLSFKSVKAFSQDNTGLSVYPCIGCSDVFPSRFVLDDHLNRQSYQLTFDCPNCYRKLNFTNKCMLYVHLISEHKITNKESCSQVAVRFTNLQVLPRAQIKMTSPAAAANGSDETNGNDAPSVEKMDVSNGQEKESSTAVSEDQPVPAAAVKDNVDDQNKTGQNEQTNGTKTPVKAATSPISKPAAQNGSGAAIVEEADDEEEDSAVTCTECMRTFETEFTLQTHFTLPVAQEAADKASEPEVCIPCRVELATPCARKAHMRLHSLAEPFVCPNCGVRMFKKNVFLKHIRLHCLHYSILSEYTCPGCPSNTFSTADEQLAHLKANPSHLRFDGEKSYYKCNGCPKAFKSVAAHSKHETCPGAGCTVVHMCNNCPQQTVFRSWSELTEHRAQAHPDLVWKPKRSRVFACYLCALYKGRTKAGLLEHLLKTHGKKKIDFMCNFCGVEADTWANLNIHKDNCQFKDIGKGTVRQAIAERVPKLSSSSSVVSDNAASPTALGEKGSAPPTSPPETTSVSIESSQDSTSHSKTRHSQISYLAHTPSFNCHLCTAAFSDYVKLRDHVTRRHDGQGLIYECWLCKDKGSTANFYRQAALDKHMADSHKIQIASPPLAPALLNGEGKEITNGDHPDSDGEDETPAKRLKIWSEENQPYQCCRCDFTSTDALGFKDHIKEHKTSADCHQCSECGMCFTVQLALRRHLIAVHKVYNYAKYSRTQYMAEFEKQLSDTQGKCPVCSTQFDDEMKLRKHLRTHGMMYINTKRVVSP